MAARTLRDFDIAITRSSDGYLVTLRPPDGNRVQASFAIPFEEYQLKYYLSELTRGPQPTRRSTRGGPGAVAQEVGAALFDAMFAGAALQRLDAALDALGDARHEGLRLCIDLSGAPELAAMPWEYLYHRNRNFFLALSPDLSVVRYVQMPEPVRKLHVEPPLRVLAMACSPRDLPPLDVARERDRMRQSLSRLVDARMVEVDWVAENSLAAIIGALAQRDYHIFHFMGHGALEEEEGRTRGFLMFEGPDGAATLVGADRLGQAFRRSVRLALINACEGAVGDVQAPASGVATSLLEQGVPAVVAMQFAISDEIAIQFASEFYSAVASGLPVDAAVTSARRNVWATYDDNAEWATPVLFLRAPDGNIFDLGALAPADARTAELQQEVIGATMANLNVELVQLKSFLASGSREVVRRLPEWVAGRLGSSASAAKPPVDVEALYQGALVEMQNEQWGTASRIFKQLNERAPGYKDTYERWQVCNRQEKLADQYRRMVGSYAEAKWQRAIDIGDGILREEPGYKDTLTITNRARQALGLPPRPMHLPDRPPPAPKPPAPQPDALPPPASLPGPPSSRPPALPPAGESAPKPDKPPSLPSQP
jgi:hypothetical protein